MFSMVFKMFLVCFLLTAAASGVLDHRNAVQALYARCLSVICIVLVILSGAALFATGKWGTITTFLGSIPIVVFCFVTAFLVWKGHKKDDYTQGPASELTEDKSADFSGDEMEYSEDELWEDEDIYEVYAESQDDKKPSLGQEEASVGGANAAESNTGDNAINA